MKHYPQIGATLRLVLEDYGDVSGNPLGNVPYVISLIPKRCSVDINTYTQADTFEMEIDYKCFPFDPRIIKSAQISIHLQDMKALVDTNGLPRRIQLTQEQGSVAGGTALAGEDNAIFLGFADEESIELNDSTRAITFKGRDYTAIFIDAPWGGKLVNQSSGSIDLILASILASLPAAGDIRLDNRTGLTALPNIAPNVLDFGKLSGSKNTRKKDTYWNVIQRVAAEGALIAYMELDKLVLTKPRTLYSKDSAVQFFYGHNIKNLSFSRKIGRQKSFNVRVASFNPEKKVKIVADIPRESLTLPQRGADIFEEKISIKGGVSTKTEEPATFMTFLLSDIPDKASLITRGEKIFEEIGRQQIEGEFTTFDMDAPQGRSTADFSCFDLTKLRPGKPVDIRVDLVEAEALKKDSSIAEKIGFLVRRGYEPKVATALAQTYVKFATPFYTKAVQYTMDAQSGLKIRVQFLNFIETAGFGK